MNKQLRVLVADDSLMIRTMLARSLQALGYQVQTVTDGVAAVESAWAEVPDLVLLDVEMPRMNGYQVARLLRHEPRTSDIPIVFLTSHAAAGDVFWGMEAGGDAYLVKGTGDADIPGTIARVLAARPASPAIPAEVSLYSADVQIDVLARVNSLLDRKLYEATILNQLGQLAAELRDYNRAAERAGELLGRFLDYQVVGLLFLHTEPAEALVLARGRAANHAGEVVRRL